jgi:hypothetical protein
VGRSALCRVKRADSVPPAQAACPADSWQLCHCNVWLPTVVLRHDLALSASAPLARLQGLGDKCEVRASLRLAMT